MHELLDEEPEDDPDVHEPSWRRLVSSRLPADTLPTDEALESVTRLNEEVAGADVVQCSVVELDASTMELGSVTLLPKLKSATVLAEIPKFSVLERVQELQESALRQG